MTGGEQAANLLYLLGVLVLVGSALAVRRIPLRTSLKMALGWILIFAILFAVIALRHDFAALGSRLLQAVTGEAAAEAGPGGEVRIRQSADGHFWVDGELNGQSTRFLVDSGATVTSLSPGAARRAGIEPSGGPGVMVSTANGVIVAQRGRAGTLRIGSIQRDDLAVHIADGFGDTNVLGMNFLSSLSGWSVDGQTLVLRP